MNLRQAVESVAADAGILVLPMSRLADRPAGRPRRGVRRRGPRAHREQLAR
jgi:hypothetical protein